MKYSVTIKLESPMHLSSGRADVNIDADVARDEWGMPYFPAKRFKGVLYESALEIVEMSALSGAAILTEAEINQFFNRGTTEHQNLVIYDFFLKNHKQMKEDWSYLQHKYKEYLQPVDVLQEYTSIRYQTAIDRTNGMTVEGSLHNMRVVDANLEFQGVIEVMDENPRNAEILALALQNVSVAGLKRTRGFGKMSCQMQGQQDLVKSALKKAGV